MNRVDWVERSSDNHVNLFLSTSGSNKYVVLRIKTLETSIYFFNTLSLKCAMLLGNNVFFKQRIHHSPQYDTSAEKESTNEV
uniref:Uncharacterized protein n=1 Tax=Onchocerca volvulus TaxID=6282 RepID=A0A8R1TT94_ONCVO